MVGDGLTNKKLLLGSIIAVTILILIPSTSAIQLDTSQLDFEENAQLNDDIKFPKLYDLISFWLNIRFFRFIVLMMISGYYVNSEYEVEVLYPILFLRALWIIYTTVYLSEFIQILSDRFGWNWRMLFS